MIETLDVRTLLIILILGHAIAALLLFFFTRTRALQWDTVFMISMALQSAGWLLLFFRGVIADIFSFSFGNTLIFCGFCLEGLALLSLVRPVDKRWQWFSAAVLAVSLLLIWLPLSGQDLNVGLVSFVIPLFFVFPAVFLVFSGLRPSPLQRFTGCILLFYIAAVLSRGVYLLVAKNYSLLEPTFFQILFLSGQIVIMVLASTSYILIRREFAVEDLEQDITRRRQVDEEYRVQSELLESRVRELRCLYTIGRLVETDPEPVSFLAAVARSLPEGYRNPATTGARIITQGREYRSDNFREGIRAEQAPLMVNGEIAGSIEIVFFYVEPDSGRAVFSPEDAELLSAVAERIGRVLERISAEKSRHESEEKYRTLFEQVSDAIFIADVGTRQITDCNRKAEDLIGYTRSEILAMNADALHPSDLQVQTMDRFRAFLEGKTSSIETEVIARYGKRVPVSINATPVEFGGRSYLIGIFRDITWQNEVQKAIQERTEEVDRFFSTSLDLFCIADMDGYFRRLNPEWEKTLGWTVAELEGKKFLDYVHPDDLQATLGMIQVLISQKEVTGFVNRYRHQDGTWRWIEWRSAPAGTRIFAAARDITRHYLDEHYNAGLSTLKQELLISAPLEEKLRKITDACVSLFGADFARIWMTGPGDLCGQGCIHAGVAEGPDTCRDHAVCLHLMVSSGRYTHTDGGHRRVPFGAYKIGRIAAGEESHLITNDVVHDPRVHDHAWAAGLGLVAFAGFRLLSREGKPVGVLALFSRQQVTPDMVRYLDDVAVTASQVIQTAKAEEALRESEERFRRLLTRSFDAVVVHQGGRIVLVNDAAIRIVGASDQGDLIGTPVIDLVHPDYREAVAGRVREMLSSKAETVPLLEEKFLRLDGTPITVAVMATTTQHKGKPAVMVVFRNITAQKDAEEALKNAKQFSDAIIDSIPGIFYVFDEQGRFIRSNRNHKVVLGYSDDELQQITSLDTIAPEDRGLVTEKLREAFIHDFTTVTANVLTKDGRKIPYLLGGLWMTVAGKKYLVGTGIDITEQVRAQEALRESEDRFSRAIAGTGAGLWDWDIVNDRVFFSPQWKSMLGYDDHEIANDFSGWKNLWHPDDVARIEKAVNDYLEGRTAVYEVEHRLRHKDGSWHWILTRGDIHRDPAGRPVRWAGTNIDITDRKLAEEALRESEARYHNLIDTSHDIIYSLSREGAFLFVSPAWTQIVGHPVADVIGRNFAEFVHPDDLPACYDFLQKVLESGERQEGVEYRVKHVDGSWRWHSSSATPIQEAANGIARFTGIAHDITGRKRSEEALRAANKKLNLLSSITRHDIRNQLLALEGYLSLSRETIENPGKLRDFLEKEERIAQNIGRQISFTKDYEDLGVKAPTWQDVALLVRNVSTSLPLQDIRLEILCPNLEIYADPLLEKVFYNLIDNSLHYGGEKMTVIRITAEQAGDTFRIVYEDDGEGISATDKTLLFTKGFGKHTGLGLFLSREILAITGITLAENGKPGHGVCFVMTVPKGEYRFSGNPSLP